MGFVLFERRMAYEMLIRDGSADVCYSDCEFAGLCGSVQYARVRGKAAQYWPVFGGFIFSASAEGGLIHALENRNIPGSDDVRLTDRFFLGEPQIRGLAIRGVGPRVLRQPYGDDEDGNQVAITTPDQNADTSRGGQA